MPQYKYKVFVNARFNVVWQKLLDKIKHPDKYVEGIREVEILEDSPDHIIRVIRFNTEHWQDLKELIVADESSIREVEILEDSPDHIIRVIRFNTEHWQDLKELIVADESSGIIVYRLIDHPHFEGETVNICRTTNQVYHSELEYEINWKLKDQNQHESLHENDLAEAALQLAVNEMKKVSEEAESVYNK
ncbi:unnamed protein product [Adineta steineri]|uniref:Uncharacterized protein n=1 Tax=Adineta steineri TaxID=433720 RepID=A0A814DZV6_9BILA|nr:unnamed protein product [Adineta steineri]